MAFTIEQKPNQLAGANNPMMFVLKESTTIINDPKFKYVAKIYKSTTNASTWSLLTTIKVPKNNAGVGIIDIHKVVRTSLETQLKDVGNQESIDGSIHSVGKNDTSNIYSQNTSQVVGIKVEGGYEKATSQTTAPVVTLPSGGVDGASEIIYSIPATTPFTDTGTNEGGLDIDGTNNPMTKYIPQSIVKQFLTNSPTYQFVRGGNFSSDNVDELTLAFIQDGLITDGAPIEKINVSYYLADGSLINSVDISNVTGVGGKASADDVKNSLIYFGAGTYNLQSFNNGSTNLQRPSNNTNWAYYTIKGLATSGGVRTKTYYFYRYGAGITNVEDRHQSCNKYDNIRLAWRNRLGCWDYMNFRGKSMESIDIKSEEIERVVGSWNSATFTYENFDRGRETLFTEAQRKLVVNTDWLNEDEGAWLEELFTSTNVHLLDDNSIVYPMIITNKNYTKKTSVNDKMKIQYTINLEYANKVKTNS
tara:strand:- start:5772 stop:7199 length:1428 start_codon:yes stop_codon:yes gene_type:complete